MEISPSRTTVAFEEAYKRLNKAQKQAVDAVEGPVVVIAGPGTGKTHLLTLRIANILLKTATTSPENILVLTFTDSAARTIRRRLGAFIGEESARKIPVFTFHSFAQYLLQAFPASFSEYADRRLMGELESTLLWREVLEQEKIQYLRTPKSPFHYLRDLRSLEDELLRERVSLEEYEKWIAMQEKEIQAHEKYRYKRGTKNKDGEPTAVAGDLNPAGLKKLEQLERAREASRLIQMFRAAKEKKGVYGYTDVLRIAVDGVQQDAALRAELQERYQYVLADEHQDANALQHALLDALAFDEHPNIFIVGDEKQAIFGFQGADTDHFKTFVEQYPRAQVISLTENYRSYQEILDQAHSLLGALPAVSGEHIQLVASRGSGAGVFAKSSANGASSGASQVHLLIAPDPLAERDQIAQLVEKAIAEGVVPSDIAIITLKNATADLFATHLRAKGIPTLRAGDINLEGNQSIRFLLALMHAVADASNTPALREALLAPWWGSELPLSERSQFLRRFRDFELADALAATFPNISKTIQDLQNYAAAQAPLPTFSKILADSDARDFFLSHGDSIEEIPLVRQISMYIEELVAQSPNRTFAEVMELFEKAREHGLGSIKTSSTEREGFVTVITAHKSKGMEFARVFVVALTAQEWESQGMRKLIPAPFDDAHDIEDVARFLYVAMTRAKDALVLSYAAENAEGKETPPTQLLPSNLPQINIVADPIPLFHTKTDVSKDICDLTLAYLEHEGLSPSAFNEYLESPARFFARRVLRLREPETAPIAIGNAVHAGVAGYLQTYSVGAADSVEAATSADNYTKKKGMSSVEARHAEGFAALERSLARSLLPRNETFDQLARHARTSLEVVLQSDSIAREPIATEETFSMRKKVAGKDILLRGKIDAVFKTSDGECIVDFKTSSNVKANKEDYEHQLAFYDLLLRENNHAPTSAQIIQISDEKVTKHSVALNAETRAAFSALLEEVLQELISGKWRVGEPTEYDALLKLF